MFTNDFNLCKRHMTHDKNEGWKPFVWCCYGNVSVGRIYPKGKEMISETSQGKIIHTKSQKNNFRFYCFGDGATKLCKETGYVLQKVKYL